MPTHCFSFLFLNLFVMFLSISAPFYILDFHFGLRTQCWVTLSALRLIRTSKEGDRSQSFLGLLWVTCKPTSTMTHIQTHNYQKPPRAAAHLQRAHNNHIQATHCVYNDTLMMSLSSQPPRRKRLSMLSSN